MAEPTPIFPVYLRPEEANQIIAIWEKTGALGSVVTKIRSAQGLRNNTNVQKISDKKKS